jgi:hypothetical protein
MERLAGQLMRPQTLETLREISARVYSWRYQRNLRPYAFVAGFYSTARAAIGDVLLSRTQKICPATR